MTNVVTLHGDKRWRAVIEYSSPYSSHEHYFEEIADLPIIIERGPDWNFLARCTVTLNRNDNDGAQHSASLREVKTDKS
ncbi:hypothetical protein SAMN03080618_03571 [Aquamicrobium aerolatum DSM 21857]|uniref:Uncharacterized protein n=1 Tax=Aquamicrobium aerolatum DSM 21857 TaxID=1121003 RepID=A0A1I3T4E3_9HYPH|nr:hypothetical protein SAMN03080618_03571 [Aquamicrobium aerolatum DSM 21857]